MRGNGARRLGAPERLDSRAINILSMHGDAGWHQAKSMHDKYRNRKIRSKLKLNRID
ncbi:protein of unknown function [Rhodovastum atsumiense]|nr:protein of unknown function [Rhodovastum atsumiense]